MNNPADQVSAMFTELEHLRSKDRANENMILLLKEQNEFQSMELAKMVSDHANEVRELKQRRDLAVRREAEVTGILNTAATSIVSGLRKMQGDDTPEKMPERRGPVESHPLLQQDPYAPKAGPKPEPAIDPEFDADVSKLVRSIPRRV
jgi:hypothetical protein